jgi:hypothetical protein
MRLADAPRDRANVHIAEIDVVGRKPLQIAAGAGN